MITKESKVLITGCGGMLGEGVYKEFSDKCNVLATDIDLNENWLSMLDVRNKADIKKIVNDFNPGYIVHLAALTDMEYCEKNIIDAYRTNTEAVQFLSREAQKRNIPFLYISTAGIFDGEKESYEEEDMPNPLSVYGRSKYLGELITLSIPKSVVIRAGWMMGGGPRKDKKFIGKVIKQINEGNKEIFALTDKLGVPCYTYDLARSIYYLLDNEKYGLYHGACDGEASRFDVAERLLETLKLEKKIKLTEVTSDYFQEEYFAPRPHSEILINNKLKKLDGSLTRDWTICLDEYLAKFDWIKTK
jgi:dTDP-4-dehydrorhamnose reductase